MTRPCPRTEELELGEEAQSYCGHCKKNVHVLSNMEPGEVQDFVAGCRRDGGDRCVAFVPASQLSGPRAHRAALVLATLGTLGITVATSSNTLGGAPPVTARDADVPCKSGDAEPVMTAGNATLPDPAPSKPEVHTREERTYALGGIGMLRDDLSGLDQYPDAYAQVEAADRAAPEDPVAEHLAPPVQPDSTAAPWTEDGDAPDEPRVRVQKSAGLLAL